MQRVKNRPEYDTLFNKGPKPQDVGDDLRLALDIRKFEIDLYWKRATYSWTLIAASFAGYFVLQGDDPTKRDYLSIFIVACIGAVLSFSWYLVNEGSKYWQQNWERHMDLLCERDIGPLFRTTLPRSVVSAIRPSGAFPFSVSRVNQVISLSAVLLWVALGIRTYLTATGTVWTVFTGHGYRTADSQRSRSL